MKKLLIYTDGSHLKHTTGRLGIGGVLVDARTNTMLSKFSEEIDLEYLKTHYGTTDVSNPTCEMLANLWALRQFRDWLTGGDTEVCMKADFIGVQNFNTGVWRTKAPYIKTIKEETQKEVLAQGLKDRIHYEWVKGHQTKAAIMADKDAYWNAVVDGLSKGENKK